MSAPSTAALRIEIEILAVTSITKRTLVWQMCPFSCRPSRCNLARIYAPDNNFSYMNCDLNILQ